MPPAENTPDFDSMTPEELMAWMETLAERQGASEGFTTSKRVDIAEVDASQVQDTGPGYIPYGMTPEQWEKKQAEEAAKKATRQPSQPSAPAPIPVSAPPPVPQPAVSAAPATPDFDSMSPEELMAWMETLAERQGADIGFTTSKRVEIAEVDASQVQDTGPGYIPYGMTPEQWEKKQADEAAKKAAKQASRPAAATPPAVPPPAPAPEPEPQFDLPTFELELEDEGTTEIAPAMSEGDGLSWLESLAANPAGGDFPQVDLSALGNELPTFDIPALDLDALTAPLASPEAADPMQWLESLADSQEQPFDLPTDEPGIPAARPRAAASAPPVPDPMSSGVDPMEWLESLAKRQGADSEELTTSASLDVPLAAASAPDAPGYTGYAFEEEALEVDLPDLDDIDALDVVAVTSNDDPVAWLDSLAASQNAEGVSQYEEEDTGEIAAEAQQDSVMQALDSAHEVAPEDIKSWMDNLLEKGATRSDDFVYDEDEEEEQLQAQIPDWLLEQVGPPPELGVAEPPAPKAEPPALINEIVEPEQVELPDWLQENVEAQEELDESIFVLEDEPRVQPAISVPATHAERSESDIEIDVTDPWVEAFELERAERLGQPAPDFASSVAHAEALQQANLPPETELVAGEPEALPDWLGAAEPLSISEQIIFETQEEPAISDMPDWLKEQVMSDTDLVPVVDEDLPDWLKESGVDKTDTVPDWLLETVGEDQPVAAPAESTPAAPLSAPAVRPAASVSPAPAAIVVSAADVAALLESAHSYIGSGNVAAGLQDYEAVVRANTQLQVVVDELTSLTKQEGHRANPAIYRVLGDGLMRQGRLQEALDTYRKALNLL